MSQPPIAPQSIAPVLVVDDDPDVLHALKEQLAWEGYTVIAKENVSEALSLLAREAVSVVISDQRMPDLTGLEFLEKVKQLQPHTSRVLITGVLSLDTMIEAINHGEIFRFLAKPWVRAELLATVKNATQRYQLLVSNDQLQADTAELNNRLACANADLQTKVEELTAQKKELDSAHQALEKNFGHSLELCYRMINTFHPLLGQQTHAVVEICRKMAESDYFTGEEKHVLIAGAWLHDIGLVGTDRKILHRLHTSPTSLTDLEVNALKKHPVNGQMLASFVDNLRTVGETIRAHHERFDGHGYPDGLAGQSIPWTARCLAVAVQFVECGLPKSQAVEEIARLSGTVLDPEAVRLFFKTTQAANLPKQIREIMIDEMSPGMRLVHDIYSPVGLLLLPEGQALNETTITKIKNHNLQNSVTQRLLVYR